jgi:hypothetical protein
MDEYPFEVRLGSMIIVVDGLVGDVVDWAKGHDHEFIQVTSFYNGEIVFYTI